MDDTNNNNVETKEKEEKVAVEPLFPSVPKDEKPPEAREHDAKWYEKRKLAEAEEAVASMKSLKQEVSEMKIENAIKDALLEHGLTKDDIDIIRADSPETVALKAANLAKRLEGMKASIKELGTESKETEESLPPRKQQLPPTNPTRKNGEYTGLTPEQLKARLREDLVKGEGPLKSIKEKGV